MILAMDIFYFAAFIAPVVALIERNHRRHHLPRAPWGAADDRDLERIRHDLHLAGDPDRERVTRRPTASFAETLDRPASSAGAHREAAQPVCRAAS